MRTRRSWQEEDRVHVENGDVEDDCQTFQGLLYWAKAEAGDDGDGEQSRQEQWEEAFKVFPN